MEATSYTAYRQALQAHLVAYRRRHFAARRALFEPGPRGNLVFTARAAHLNFFDPALYHALTRRPPTLRRMTSARVLAISVFGTLARREDLALLARLPCDDGAPLLSAAGAGSAALDLQRPLDALAAPRPRSIDLWLAGEGWQLAILPRLLERGLPACPELRRGRCAGGYRPDACRYAASWRDPGALSAWDAAQPVEPCPMAGPFVLARALLASTAPAPGGARAARRGAVLVYDARNPAFAAGSRADRLFAGLQQALPPAAILRRTTWQSLAAAMARSDWYADLVEYLAVKYGIEA